MPLATLRIARCLIGKGSRRQGTGSNKSSYKISATPAPTLDFVYLPKAFSGTTLCCSSHTTAGPPFGVGRSVISPPWSSRLCSVPSSDFKTHKEGEAWSFSKNCAQGQCCIDGARCLVRQKLGRRWEGSRCQKGLTRGFSAKCRRGSRTLPEPEIPHFLV